MSDLAAVIMAAGLGTRMKSATPKHLHPLLGRRLIDWVVGAVEPLRPDPLVLVVAPDAVDAFDGANVAVQEKPLGTGDSLRAARDKVADAKQLLVVSGDHPRLSSALLQQLVDEHRRSGVAATVLSFEPPDPLAYGRIVRGEDGRLRQIVENADADEEQRAIREVNSSIYVFEADRLWPALDRINEAHMLAGVTIVDPQTTWIDPTVELEPDSTIQPFTILRGESSVARGAEVGPHAVVVDSEVGPDALVGPFCYLRPGTVLEAGAKAGAFVEVKNSRLGAGVKAAHQSYIGDADIGEGTNIGAGNITANFPHEEGKPKGRTKIGRNVRTGVHNAFVAPVEIGDDAWVGAGSVITDDVPPEALAVARTRQENREGYVRRKREQDG